MSLGENITPLIGNSLLCKRGVIQDSNLQPVSDWSPVEIIQREGRGAFVSGLNGGWESEFSLLLSPFSERNSNPRKTESPEQKYYWVSIKC